MSRKREQRKRERMRRRSAGGSVPKRSTSPRPKLDDLQATAALLNTAARDAVARFLESHDRAAQFIALTTATRDLALDAIRRSPDFTRHECRAGCAFCCHTAVTVAPPEALTIMDHLREHCGADQLAEIRRHIGANAAHAARMTHQEYVGSNIRCALLTDSGECRVHAVRPLACAGFLSTSRAACEAEFNRVPGRPRVPVDRYALLAGLSVSHGLQEACRNAGIDGEFYELHHALRALWDRPDAPRAWAAGQALFADCRRASTW